MKLRAYLCGKWIGGIVLCLIALLVFLSLHNVSGRVTVADKIYIKRIFHASDIAKPKSYEQEIEIIRNVQSTILNYAPGNSPIPVNQTREPEDIFALKHGNCSDRARFIDKTLRTLGFQTRYASIYKGDSITALFRMKNPEGADSHALVEVKTSKGWMVVDSVRGWISLDAQKNPVNLTTWKAQKDKKNFIWDSENAEKIYPLLEDDFVYLYGLYSRHGRFYPPYGFFPDISWPEFLKNNF